MFVLGLDIGDIGATALLADADGRVHSEHFVPFAPPPEINLLPPGFLEQSPESWWSAAAGSLRSVVESLAAIGESPESVTAIAVSFTDGAVVALGESGKPLRPAIAAQDTRAAHEAGECNTCGVALTDKLGFTFTSAHALPKIMWLAKHEPQVFYDTAFFLHPGDYIVGRLTGDFGLSDTSGALSAGYDPVDHRWPAFIESALGVPAGCFPRIVSSGLIIGEVSRACSHETGLAPSTPVVAGVCGDVAEFLASGAAAEGEWNLHVASGITIRGASGSLIKDPENRTWCRMHPQDGWILMGECNSGAAFAEKLFHGRNHAELCAYAPMYSPTDMIVYPLVAKGERLPFANPGAEGFIIGQPRDSRELFTAYLEGAAYMERWCLEVFGELGAKIGDTVFSTGAVQNAEWMQVRASVLNRRVVCPRHEGRAFGAAVLAASGTFYSDIETSARALSLPAETAEPDPMLVDSYLNRYGRLREACARRGYGRL
jgi:sugar (pentulose or hexulose) kinase